MSTPENPPAFPYVEPPTTCNVNTGMSLRDYFAGQALVGIISSLASESMLSAFAKEAARVSISTTKAAGIAAYEYADAMLAARKEPQ